MKAQSLQLLKLQHDEPLSSFAFNSIAHPYNEEKRHWHIEGCSAVTGEGLLQGFDWCVKDIGNRIYMYD